MALIELNNVKKIFSMGLARVHALDGVSVSIEQGEFVAVSGPSGSGKSTLMNVMGLLDTPDEGEYRLLGQRIEKFSDDQLAVLRRNVIGFIFQQFHLLPRVTARENVALPFLYSKKYLDFERAEELISQVGLRERMWHKTHELSGGQQQRVAIARALANRPAILFADEPTGNLDSKTSREVMEMLVELNRQGITIIMVTHEKEIADYATRQITMMDGQIVRDQKNRLDHDKKMEIESFDVKNANSGLKGQMALFLQGIKALRENKTRTILSMLGIMIGVASVITMLALGQGAKKSIEDHLSSLGSNLLVLQTGAMHSFGVRQEAGETARLRLDDAEDLKRRFIHIKEIGPQVRGRAQLVFGNKNWNTTVYGVLSTYERMRSATPTMGRFFTDEENLTRKRVVLVGQTVVRELFGERNPVGEMLKINKVNFQILGILPAKGAAGWRDQDDVVVVPLQTAMKRILGKNYVDEIEIEVDQSANISGVEQSVLQFMNQKHRVPPSQQEDAFRVRNMADIQSALSASSSTMSLLLASIAAVSLIVGGIGIMNIMLVSVTERTREIGLRKAIGATRKDIMLQFLVESVAISFVGGLIGVLLGQIAVGGIKIFAGWTTSIEFWSIGLAISFATAVGIIFGLYPAKKAAYLRPIESLRHD